MLARREGDISGLNCNSSLRYPSSGWLSHQHPIKSLPLWSPQDLRRPWARRSTGRRVDEFAIPMLEVEDDGTGLRLLPRSADAAYLPCRGRV